MNHSTLGILAVLAIGCGGDKSKPYLELDAKHGTTVRVIAAWIPLLARSGGSLELRAADHARAEIHKHTPKSPAIGEGPTGLVDAALFSLSMVCDETSRFSASYSYEPSVVRREGQVRTQKQVDECREGIARFESVIDGIARDAADAGTPPESIIAIAKPDPVAKKEVAELLALTEPGPKAKAWAVTKADTSADHKVMTDSCHAAAEEWKPRFAKFPGATESDSWMECLEVGMGSLVMTMIKKCPKENPDCLGLKACEQIAKSMLVIDTLPKHWAPDIKQASAACGK